MCLLESLLPDFTSLASVIISNFVEQGFLSKKHNLSSLCHKQYAKTV